MSAPTPEPNPVFGILAEFDHSEDLVAAVHAARGKGYREMEAYTPLPLHEVSEALGYKSHLPKIVLAGGILGALSGFALQYWTSVIDYPLNIGGRPDNSWPSFIVVVFELTILFAAIAAVLGMLALNGLPRPHHPVFAAPPFELASRNRFFLMILSRDKHFDAEPVRSFLEAQTHLTVTEVPA